MNGLLKTELGFQGFVVSDWSAQHTGLASATAGLDMVMPLGSAYWGNNLTIGVRNGSLPESRINDMATRILTAWFHAGQNDPSTPSVGSGLPYNYLTPHDLIDARDPTDDASLLQSAIEGHVLVKNVNGTLPLRKPSVISVYGYDARPLNLYNTLATGRSAWAQGLDSGASFVCGFFSVRFSFCPPMPAIQFNGTVMTGGGSGAATPAYVVSPYEAINERARKDKTSVFWDFDTYGANSTVNAASDACLVFLNAIAAEGKYCFTKLPLCKRALLTSYSRSVGIDRPNLRDEFSDTLVRNVASRCSNTIVTIHNAGIRLVDAWVDHPNVTAVIFGHLPGQDSGRAIVDILYGEVSPSGKLPYTVARNESEYGPLLAPVLTDNASDYRYFPQDNFLEGVYIDYRAFDQQNIEPRFEFGFGLSYTTFEYSDLQITRVATGTLASAPSGDIIPGGHEDLWDTIFTISAQVTNAGSTEAAEIAQLYIGIPCEDQPIRQLRGFDKRVISVGESITMEFPLKRRDLSIWNVTTQRWELVSGRYRVYVGASSRNLPLIGEFQINQV